MENNKIKVLLAEDDPNLGNLLKTYLEAKGFPTQLCNNGQIAFDVFKTNDFNFCIVDVMMPIKDGFTLVKDIRKLDKKVPVLFLTAKNMQEDKLKGFQIGADDYITKPFSMEELLMRMEAILRRTQEAEKQHPVDNFFNIGKYYFDFNRQILSIEGREQKLTSKETDLLMILCQNANDVVDRSVALNKIWKDDSYFNARSMDVYITKLRKYLKEDPQIELLNVHGVGFKLIMNS
ncbi:MAG: response regulator transcription factor [Bacteroidetes bacterium]|nr:response regulator transcription factor [Bacteroidota bacterium]